MGTEATTLQRAGPEEVALALDLGEPVRLLLVARGPLAAAEEVVVDRARRLGVPILTGTDNDLLRMSRTRPPARLLALLGRRPGGDIDEVLARGGATWLLAGVRYPSNVGYVVRTAEVSGATAVLVDARFTGRERAQVTRVAMGADRFIPVLPCDAADAAAKASAAGSRLVAIEDHGALAPWEADLTGDVLLVVGGERDGIPGAVLEHCDEVIRVPMAGFVPSYSVQAPVAAVAVERLRQLTLA